MKNFLFIALVSLVASSCSPMFSTDLKDSVLALGKDKASLCARARGGAAGLTVAPAPAIPASGGYGDLVLCRSNEPGSEITVTADSITIKHGSAVGKDIADRIDTLETAVKYLLQKLLDAKTAQKDAAL